jgi:eukaryotic-like serine/threonine-protein kinase
MRGHVTLLQREVGTPDSRGVSSALPPDLLEQVRGRVQLLSALLFAAFAFDIVVYLIEWLVAVVQGIPKPPHLEGAGEFQWVNLAAVAASAGLWWTARKEYASPSRLLHIGLVYEVVICAVIATLGTWQNYLDSGMVPNLTWVPAMIILFPLILPGPPRRMLAAAIAAGATVPIALCVLELTGKVEADAGDYVRMSVHSTFAVVFAYLGARVIYRLGREVRAARELGSYRLEELLGRGGMGEVWRARHRMLARPAAVKVIRPTAGGNAHLRVSEDAMRRFEREAQVIARLRSPHTVELFDFGVADSGVFYYAMELLEGLDADTLVRRFGPLPADRAIHVLRQICHSLSEAESCGLVHRDIKPANIFLCRYGEDCDFAKVLDFGLVRAFGERPDATPALTQANMIAGTPAFIAPEQALGRPVDGRADIYATGCVAYWLLTGELVFTADTPMGLLMHHTQTEPPSPAARSEMPIPEALDGLVLACLAKDPAARPQTARELSRRLAAVEGANAWTEDRARAWWADHLPPGAASVAAPDR